MFSQKELNKLYNLQSEFDFRLNNYYEDLKGVISEKVMNECYLKNSKTLNECYIYKIDFRFEYENFLTMWLKKFRFENQILSVDDKHLKNLISFDCFVEKVYNYIINVLEFDLEIKSSNEDSYFFSKDISSWSFKDKISYDSDSVYLLFRNDCTKDCFSQHLKNKILNIISEKNLKKTFDSLLYKIQLKALEDIRNLKNSTKFNITALMPALSEEAYQTLHNMLYSYLSANDYDFELENDIFELHFTARYNEKHTE